MSKPITVFWFRRDLRLSDNRGLFQALQASDRVLPLFIFDAGILKNLAKDDHRLTFIHDTLVSMQQLLAKEGRGMMVKYGDPLDVFQTILKSYDVNAVYCNGDHEPYGQNRDTAVRDLLVSHAVSFHSEIDHLVFDKDEVLKADGSPYKVFTPYSQQWKVKLSEGHLTHYPSEDYLHRLVPVSVIDSVNSHPSGDSTKKPSFNDLDSRQSDSYDTHSTKYVLHDLHMEGFVRSSLTAPDLVIDEEQIKQYDQNRDYPSKNGSSRLGVHLRFGTLSIRELVKKAFRWNEIFLNELIWREFYALILWHFPYVVNGSFKPEYDRLLWRNDGEEFQRWTSGYTGYPMVDAGMRQLNATGFMHNRLRMITASFLTKHLLIDWRWGEAYFARKLFDYELSSNNGGWQWAAGTGCDAAPYFRIFNPAEQQKKFDRAQEFVKRWIPEFDTEKYPGPLVDHKKARERCLRVYKDAL